MPEKGKESTVRWGRCFLRGSPQEVKSEPVSSSWKILFTSSRVIVLESSLKVYISTILSS